MSITYGINILRKSTSWSTPKSGGMIMLKGPQYVQTIKMIGRLEEIQRDD